MSRMTQCAASLVGFKSIRLRSRVDRIAYFDDGRVELSAQGLHQTHTEAFDAVVIATPPAAIHSIVDRPIWSFMKEQAIRGAHYEPLYKIGLHFRTRFWERTDKSPASADRAQRTSASAGSCTHRMIWEARALAYCCCTVGYQMQRSRVDSRRLSASRSAFKTSTNTMLTTLRLTFTSSTLRLSI